MINTVGDAKRYQSFESSLRNTSKADESHGPFRRGEGGAQLRPAETKRRPRAIWPLFGDQLSHKLKSRVEGLYLPIPDN